jgi:hypothetical protein
VAVAVGQGYWKASRAPRYALTFALPLLVLYETMAAILPRAETHGVRNGADVLLKSLFYAAFGRWGPVAFGALLVGAFVWLIVRDTRRHGGGMRVRVFGGMAVESLALALAFGVVVGMITARLLGALHLLMIQRGTAPAAALDVPTRLMVSLGAGLYEELLFRVILVSGLAAIGRALFGWGARASGTFAVILGAAIFSAFHYVGAYGDVLTLQSFTFRMIGGIFFSALYLLRGFGIDAWTHALYDVLLLFAMR